MDNESISDGEGAKPPGLEDTGRPVHGVFVRRDRLDRGGKSGEGRMERCLGRGVPAGAVSVAGVRTARRALRRRDAQRMARCLEYRREESVPREALDTEVALPRLEKRL